MSSEAPVRATRAGSGEKLVYWLALLLVIVGLLNAMPGIPGVDDAFAGFLGFKHFVIRKYPYEYCLLYTSPSPRDQRGSRMPSSA